MRSNAAPLARLTVKRLTNVPGAWEYRAECDASVSTLLLIPGSLELPPGAMVLAVGWMHADECGQCDVEPVLARGDQSIRTEVDRLELLLAVRERTN
jgi:hypothetical protein